MSWQCYAEAHAYADCSCQDRSNTMHGSSATALAVNVLLQHISAATTLIDSQPSSVLLQVLLLQLQGPQQRLHAGRGQ